MSTGPKLYIASIIFLLCLGPAIYLYNLRVTPRDLPNTSLTYVGKCVNVDAEIRYVGKFGRPMYFLHMEDGCEFWFDSLSCRQGDIDIYHFYDVVPGEVITVRYIDFNLGLGSLAKKAVEIRDENEVFLSLDASARSAQKARIALWVTYAIVLISWTIAVILCYSHVWAHRKLTAHRQQTKAKRREWLDSHPEEKGAPPSARRKKDRRGADHNDLTGLVGLERRRYGTH